MLVNEFLVFIPHQNRLMGNVFLDYTLIIEEFILL